MATRVRPLRDRRSSRLERRDAPFQSARRAELGELSETAVHVRRRPARPLVLVTGALDTAGGTLLSAVLDHVRQTDGGTAEVDLTLVDYADSHGLAPVLDGRVPIHGASPAVRRVLRALGAPARELRTSGPAVGLSGRP